ncbi:precorrin-6y C5,15-methyltransferase (decarboxylating) subunit CbiE [Desulfonatronovibrio magnus]|uniref:precorrin-6y C5,15-methyltransferase (decarboxylating) subunit CbiE n=1 Tax=Desulfonatronovibrio magnus TaxID=698827 RepID=UPI0018DE7410|nr:precorrin-6y C5,15-methyltransferase (decarboxylating) subunit CbiE [Desulfonatronovibrio magnus]
MQQKKVVIVGCGPGSEEYLTYQAQQEVRMAEVVIGPPRLVRLFAEINGQVIYPAQNIADTLKDIEQQLHNKKRTTVLVSGDPGCFSLSRIITERLGPERCRVIPGISSVQLAAARLCLDWSRSQVLSVHGRPVSTIASKINSNNPLFIMLGNNLSELAPLLEMTMRKKKVYLLQNLGMESEEIHELRCTEDFHQNISSAALLVVK